MTRKESNQTKYFEIMKGKQFNYHQIILYLLDAEHALNFCFYSAMIWKKKMTLEFQKLSWDLFITYIMETHKHCFYFTK